MTLLRQDRDGRVTHGGDIPKLCWGNIGLADVEQVKLGRGGEWNSCWRTTLEAVELDFTSPEV